MYQNAFFYLARRKPRMTCWRESTYGGKPFWRDAAGNATGLLGCALGGKISSQSALDRRLSVLQLPLKSDCLSCRCVLRLQCGDAYLKDVWRYGRDRLRVAVGNLLPKEDSGVVYGVCRLTPRHVYILACAMNETDGEAFAKRVHDDVARLHRLSGSVSEPDERTEGNYRARGAVLHRDGADDAGRSLSIPSNAYASRSPSGRLLHFFNNNALPGIV